MTIFLYSLILTSGADRMAVNDPHGWTLTLISVSTVFIALVVLFCIYTLMGKFFTGTFKTGRKPAKKAKAAKGDVDGETAAAIALALSSEFGAGSETEAAISMALHLYLSEQCHDIESGIITINHNAASSPWNGKALTFRRRP